MILLLSSACTMKPGDMSGENDSAPDHIPVDIMAIPDAIPRHEQRTRAGNPKSYKVNGKQYQVLADSNGYQQKGIASWYGTKFHGKKTSNGEIYDMYAMTAAHKTLPIPSFVRVINLKNRRSVVVRINDRGPFHDNRIIDLSYTAAVQLGIQQVGTGFVEVIAIQPETKQTLKQVNHFPLGQQQDVVVYLQIGAFSNEFNAKQLQQQLFSKQITHTRVQRIQNEESDLYKVQIGPFDSVRQADEYNKRLDLLGLQKIQIITELK